MYCVTTFVRILKLLNLLIWSLQVICVDLGVQNTPCKFQIVKIIESCFLSYDFIAFRCVNCISFGVYLFIISYSWYTFPWLTKMWLKDVRHLEVHTNCSPSRLLLLYRLFSISISHTFLIFCELIKNLILFNSLIRMHVRKFLRINPIMYGTPCFNK